jgi:hypothetical protein
VVTAGQELKRVMKACTKRMLKTGEPVKVRVAKATRKRTCGDCQLCCEVLSVPDTTAVGERCEHQCDAGCAIYRERPVPCATFLCGWRMGCGPESARPDRCGALLDPDSDPTREGMGLAAVRFPGRFDEGSILLTIADMMDAWSVQRVAFVAQATDANQPCQYFAPGENLEGRLREAAATGKAPWNEAGRNQ